MICADNYPDKLRKAVYNAVIIPKGTYAYNKSLGSYMGNINYDSDNIYEQCEMAVKEAVINIKDIKYKQCILSNVTSSSIEIKVKFEYMGKIYETEVISFNG